jgi:PAS domain S-box-containing protein
MYGWKAEEALEKISHKLLRTEFPRPLEEIKARLLAHDQWEGEVIHTTKNGQRLVVASQWVLHRDEEGRPKAVLVVANDITDRKQAEREIRRLNEELEGRVAERTAQLQAVNKELEAFSYSVSHDLRAPLRHIDGFSQALLEDYTDKLDDTGKSYLQEVRSASQEMAQLIDDVLELARVTRSEMRREVVNLSELARAIAAQLKKTEPKRHVILNLKEELATTGDKRLLKIVLNNLLGNAWKFTAKRTEAQITFGREKKNGETTYFIRDNGAGFDMAYVGKLFGAFQRLHTAGEFEGTGIGLATVQRIVYRHGGRVWAEGAVNEGATFYFTLPNSKETGDEQQSDPTG